MTNHKVIVRGNTVEVTPKNIVSGCKRADSLTVLADQSWDGYQLYVVVGDVMARYDGGTILLPDSAYANPGWLPVKVVGRNGQSIRQTALNETAIRVLRG